MFLRLLKTSTVKTRRLTSQLESSVGVHSTFIEKSTSKTDLEPENVSRLRQDALFSVKIISQTVFPDP